MANRYWVGADSSWNTAGNWSATSGGSGGAGVPTASDAVIFDDQDATNCTLDVNAECLSFTNTNYVGTFSISTYNLTVGGNFQFDSGTFTLGSGTITVAGNWDTTGIGEHGEGTAVIVLTGTTKTLSCQNNQDFYSLTISGTVTCNNHVEIKGGTLTVSGTLTMAASRFCYVRANTATAFTGGTITGPSTSKLDIFRTADPLDTNGTISLPCHVGAGGTQVLPARTYGDDVYVYNLTASDLVLTAAVGTIVVAGGFYIYADGNGNCTLNAATNDPAFDIAGIVDFTGSGAGTEILQAGDGNWNVAGSAIDLTGGTFTPAASEVILDGSSAQAVTSDGESFYDLTSANTAASPGVTFVDALNVTNLFKNNTANSVMTFTDSVAYVLNTIDLDGQAVGTRVVLRPSTGANAYTWNVTTNTQADYVDVSWCDATPGIDIAATNSNDGGNNTAWTFGGVSVTVTPAALAMTGAQGTPSALYDFGHPIAAALSLTGAQGAPTLAYDFSHPIAAALGLTGTAQAPTVFDIITVEISAALALTGAQPAPTITYDMVFAIGAALGINMTAVDPDVLAGLVVEISAALALTATAQTPTTLYDLLVAMGEALGVTVTAKDPDILIGAVLVALSEALQLRGTAVSPQTGITGTPYAYPLLPSGLIEDVIPPERERDG